MGRTMDKAKLLASIEKQHGLLDDTLALVDEARMLEPGFDGGWSVKDLLAHITFWEENALHRIEAALSDSDPVKLKGTTDAVNAEAFKERRDRPLKQVLGEYRSVYEKLVEGIAKLKEEDLTDPKRFAWTQGLPLRRLIRWDTDLHYKEHNHQIRAWIDASAKTD